MCHIYWCYEFILAHVCYRLIGRLKPYGIERNYTLSEYKINSTNLYRVNTLWFQYHHASLETSGFKYPVKQRHVRLELTPYPNRCNKTW